MMESLNIDALFVVKELPVLLKIVAIWHHSTKCKILLRISNEMIEGVQ